MSMTDIMLSPGVKLAWQVAGDLAVREHESAIQPWHLLYGICSLEKLGNASQTSDSKNDPTLLAKPEREALNELVRGYGLDLSLLRRTLRISSSSSVRSAHTVDKSQLMSRAPATKLIFETAAAHASRTDTSTVDLLGLFLAVLQAHDPVIENATGRFRDALIKIVRDLNVSPSQASRFTMSVNPVLGDLDTAAAQFRQLNIDETVDASIPYQHPQATDAINRLAGLSELTWEFGTSGALDSVLQKAIDQLIRILGKGERGVILVRDPTDNELLLKACGPPGAMPMISMTSAKRAIAQQQGFIWQRSEDLTMSQKAANIESGMYVPLVVNRQSIGVICIDCFCPQQNFLREDLLLATSFAHQLALAIANHELQLSLKQNNAVLERLLTNFSPKVRTRLLQRAQMGRLRLGGEQSVVSVLCADIRGFTQLTAAMATEDVVSLLNEYFAALTDCIFRNDGTIDKFVGDAILAVFGSPEADPQHCRKAVLAGMEMQEAANSVSQRRKAKGETTCAIGIGIHTGEVLHGFIGSQERMEFTIIGDTVNRAVRYCDGAQAGGLLISPDVHQRVWNLVEAQQISIPTKHEGEIVAYRVQSLRERA